MSAVPAPHTITALLHGPDQSGLVARTAGWIFERGGSIIHADQHRDGEAGIFFQRIQWSPRQPGEDCLENEAEEFRAYARGLGMQVRLGLSTHRPRIALFVSKIEHCFLDLLARGRAGDLAGDLVCVISNHEAMRRDAEYYGLPFFYIPVHKERKAECEAAQLKKVRECAVELIVLARYMQVLSGDFLANCGCPVINIHHSFLPAFAGARPYHQAYSRGVKLIGATAHYATPILDDGPIIQQDVAPVNHRNSVDDLIRKGRDLEKSVLAQAVRWHLDNRVLVYDNKTVVFD